MPITGDKVVRSLFAGENTAKPHLFRGAIFRGIFAAISQRYSREFSQCVFRGAFSRRFRRELSHPFRGATLGVHFRSDFAATFITFFAVRL